jgi:hypothetical protein
MSFYGKTTFDNLFSVHKRRLTANESHRFGGAHAHIAYSVAGDQVPVTLHESGVEVIDAGADDVVSVILMGTKMDVAPVVTNLTLVDVADSLTLASDVHGIVLEGSVTVSDVVMDAETGIHVVVPGSVVTGSGKLATFTFVQN